LGTSSKPVFAVLLFGWGVFVNMYTRMTSLRRGGDADQSEFTLATALSDLWQKRSLILATTVAFLSMGAAYNFLSKPQYTVKSVAEIGSLPFDNSPAPVETADAVINKIKQVYAESAAQIPEFKKAFAGGYPATNAKSVRNTNAIIIENTAEGQHANALIAFQNKLIELLRTDHDKLFHVAVADLEAQRNQARLEIERLNDPVGLEAESRPVFASIDKLQSDVEALRKDSSSSPQAIASDNAIAAAVSRLEDIKDATAALQRALQQKDALAQHMTSQIEHLKTYIEKAQSGRDKIGASLPAPTKQSADDRTTMMSLLSFDAELNRKAIERDNLEQALQVTLPLDRAKIEIDRGANLRQIGMQEKAILKLKADRRAMDQDRLDRALALEQTLPGLKAKLVDIQSNRKRLIAAQEARINDITTKLKDVTGTRLLVAPRREDVPAGVSAAILVPLSTILGLATGCFAALAMALLERYKSGIGEGARSVVAPQPTQPSSETSKTIPKPVSVPASRLPTKRGPRDVLNPLLASFQVRPMPTRKPANQRPPR
jgi:hypothetical protein